MRRATYEMFHDEAAHEIGRRFELMAVVAAVILALHTVFYHFVR